MTEEDGCVHVSFILDCIFGLVFHVSLNSRNTKLKNGGDYQLYTCIALHVSFKTMYFILQSVLEFLISYGLVFTTSAVFMYVFYFDSASYIDRCINLRKKQILCNL